jgi:hypothetical protein
MRMTRSLAAVTVMTLVVACGSATEETGLHVVAQWSGANIDQLEYLVMASDGTPLHPSERRPGTAQGPLTSGADAVILMGAAFQGKSVRCQVTGYSVGVAVRWGEAPANLPASKLIDVQVNLEPAAPADGGAPPDARPDSAADRPGADAPGATDGQGSGLNTGQACQAAGQCKSGFCADGVCCDTACTGACQACNRTARVGTCGAAPGGTKDTRCATQDPTTCGFDGTCAVGGTCQRYPAGTSCSAGTCSGNILSGAGACDGNGACVTGAPKSCVPYICDAQARDCKTTCTTSADCVAPRTCSGGQCGSFRALGQTCTNGIDCVSGNCVDGVCCSTSSCAVCYACNELGGAGACRPSAAGRPDPHGRCVIQAPGTCGFDGTCDGAGACANYPDGTSCRMGRICVGGTCR